MADDYIVDCDAVGQQPSIFKPEATDPRAFGELILKIAIGQVDPPPNSHQAALKALLRGASVDIPDNMEVRIEYRDSSSFIVMIPPPDMAKRAICAMRELDANNSQDYDLTQFYVDFATGNWPPRKMMEFYERRVCDYTLSYCR